MNHVNHGEENMEAEEETLDPMETRTGEAPTEDEEMEETPGEDGVSPARREDVE